MAVVLCACLVARAAADCSREFDCVSLPGFITWQEAQQAMKDTTTEYPSVSFSVRTDGVAPLDTTWSVPVPDLTGVAEHADLTQAQRRELSALARYVTRQEVRARQDVVVNGAALVRQGSLLIPAATTFPSDLESVKRLRLAGVDTVRAMVNLAFSVLRNRRLNNATAFDAALKSPTIYERQVDANAKRVLLMALVDNDPQRSFERIDGLNRRVEKGAVVFTVDLQTRFPVRLIRFYPRPLTDSFPVAAYSLETHDGMSFRRGQELVDISQPRLGSAVSEFHKRYQEGDLPIYDLLLREESHVGSDTVAVTFGQQRYVQIVRFRSLTNVDYDIAEFEVFGDGFVPSSQYTSKPLPLQRDALPTLLNYVNGDITPATRAALSRVQGGTLGRIFWDEEKIGNPAASRARVDIQTGHTPEPEVLYRLNDNRDVVAWRPQAVVVDRRPESATAGDSVNLDDPGLRSNALAIWNALSPQERSAARTTIPEYQALGAANKRNRVGVSLSNEPDLVFWSGFQPVSNGQLIPVPGERSFFQVRVQFDSEHPDAATAVRNLRFEHLYPSVLQTVTGEIVPAMGIAVGADTAFTYAVRPRMRADDVGFNRIRIVTPVAASAVEAVELVHGRGAGGRREGVAFQELARTDSFFVVGLPRVTAAAAAGDSLAVLVRFRCRVLGTKTTFAGHVFLDERGDRDSTDYTSVVTLLNRHGAAGGLDTLAQILPQRVEEGNVLDFGEEQGDRDLLDVVTRVDQTARGVLGRVVVGPNPFTPNGDRINDELRFSYDVMRVVEPVPVVAEVFDLAGRRLRRWTSARALGEYAGSWDGRDGSGERVPPGTYLLRVRAETDEGDFAYTRLVALAY
ncbi:MAG: FlgD immunoglobulin-like domain containing protein [Candidatus Latescibacterota bacterium]